jgi:hypothetical protein
MVPGVVRTLTRDAARFFYKDTEDLTEGAISAFPGFPDTLSLSDHVTCSNCFFNPRMRGFSYVEVMDPQYWLDFKQIQRSRPCFHPMYRMEASSRYSVLDNETVAVIVTRHREKFEEDIAAGRRVDILPANSFHLGFPLWFFDINQVNQLMDAIFEHWEILEE